MVALSLLTLVPTSIKGFSILRLLKKTSGPEQGKLVISIGMEQEEHNELGNVGPYDIHLQARTPFDIETLKPRIKA